MARLLFCDYHNMVTILEKGEHNTDFHPMVDFLEASPLRFALTVKPTIYVSHLRQFWSTARIETTEEGTKILATVDGIVRTVSESSLRRNLKLRDEEGISLLPDAELFENLTLMGYNISPNQKFTFQKGQFSHQIVPLFDDMLVPQGKGSGTPTEPHHIPSPVAQTPSHTTQPTSSLPPVSITSIPTVTPTETTPIRHYTMRTRIAQSSVVADEPASLQRDVTPRVTSPVADKGSMQPNITKLTVLCTSLQRQHSELLAKFQAQEVEILKLKERVKVLEDREGIAGTRSGDDAPIKGRSIDEGEAATERISDDTEEMVTVLTSIDAVRILVGGIEDVPTGSGSIPTVGPPAADIPTGSDVDPTASPVFATATVVTPYSRRKGKEVMSNKREDKRMSEQIARDAEVARIHAEEELHSMIDENYAKIYKFQSQQRKPWTKKQKRDYYMAVIRNNLGWKVKDFEGMTFEEVEAKFNSVYKQMEDFIPMGSKEEAERYKRRGIRIPIEEVYVESLQVKHPIIDWKVHTEGHRSYWKIIRLGGSSACYQFFVDLLKHLYRDDLNQLWDLVKEYLSIRPSSSDKEMELWVELKRLDCQRQRDIHASREGLSSKEGSSPFNDLLQASSGELSHMANDLVLKIYKIANSLRQQDVEPIVPLLRNNRDTHLDYLRHLKESVETIRDIVEEDKVVRPLDRSIVSACRYTKHSQEQLEYVIVTCPQDSQQRDKQLAHIPLIRKKQVTFAKPSDKSNSNTHKHMAKVNTQKTNVPVPPSIGVIQIVLWYLDSDCSKHMTGYCSRLINFMKKFIGTVRFGNDHFGAIMGYEDCVIGDGVISRVYYVEGLGYNLFFVGQFCDSDLEVVFRKHSYYVRDTDDVELIKVSRGSNLYTISIEDMMKSSPISLFSKASKNKSWLWHRRLNHLNFEVVATACYTQNRSLIYARHNKTPYELVHNKKPDLTFFRVFGAFCYTINDSEDLGKLQPTTDIGIFVGYAPSKKGYRIYNKRTRQIMETIHVQFNELIEPMAPVNLSTGPTPNLLMPGQISSWLVPNLVPATPYVPPTNKDREILFQPMFDEYLEPPYVERPVSPTQAVQAPVNLAGTPSSTTIDQDALSPSISSSSSALQSHQGVATEPTYMEDHPVAPVGNNPFVNVFALKPNSEASSSGDISST
uniref:Integrase, catalytic region, zinc finger, CCHC-type, peptidase aspartic, catalytic n=1 Tax=Tanacetum cinerariifolium TaxID=118510 RepID=A0A6L2N3I2_TANCI|nr:integrase, catalytic region, zinc finger, CCHC-type, peptidase aspartic, catalytic [Tanacetum cinerariifolium]